MAEISFQFNKLEELVIHDQKFLFTLTSFILILGIYVNLNAFQSWALGIVASIVFFLINGIFLGNAFFKKQDTFFRLMLGILLLTALLGFAGCLAVIIHNLDTLRFTLVLFVVTTFSSLTNRRVKKENVA